MKHLFENFRNWQLNEQFPDPDFNDPVVILQAMEIDETAASPQEAIAAEVLAGISPSNISIELLAQYGDPDLDKIVNTIRAWASELDIPIPNEVLQQLQSIDKEDIFAALTELDIKIAFSFLIKYLTGLVDGNRFFKGFKVEEYTRSPFTVAETFIHDIHPDGYLAGTYTLIHLRCSHEHNVIRMEVVDYASRDWGEEEVGRDWANMKEGPKQFFKDASELFVGAYEYDEYED